MGVAGTFITQICVRSLGAGLILALGCFGGVEDVLSALHGRDIPMALATSKAEPADEQAPPPGTNVAPRAIDERTAYQLVSMMRDVVQRGTGTAATLAARSSE